MVEPAADVVLRAAGLRAGYGPQPVLHHLDFSLARGEIVVILGANGAGKTTTMRAICGMIPAVGSVTFLGRELIGKRPDQIARLGVAHVPQGRGTFAELTVRDNLLAGAYSRRDRRSVANDLDEWFDVFPALGRRADQPAGQLSGGEQQMLALARALLSHPQLLLLDEPSLGLGPIVVAQLFHRLFALNRDRGTTMLIVEQNANLALEIAARGYVLETGAIVRTGTAAELHGDDAVRRAYLGR